MSKLATFFKAFNVCGIPQKIGKTKYPELANMYHLGGTARDRTIVWDAEGQPYQLQLDNNVWWKDESYRTTLRRHDGPLPDELHKLLYQASLRRLDRLEKELGDDDLYDDEE